MREFIQKFGIYIISIALVVAALVYFTFGLSRGPVRGTTALAFYVDENNLNDASVHSALEIPPLKNKDGKPTLVQAIKRSCDGGKTSYIAYLRKYSAEAQEQLAKMTDINDVRRPQVMERGMLVRAPKAGSEWVQAVTADGEKVIAGEPCPDGGRPIVVFPRR